MWSYIVRRLVQALFTLLIITGVCFTLTRLSADPMQMYATKSNVSAEERAAVRARLGLDQPIPVQYLKWLVSGPCITSCKMTGTFFATISLTLSSNAG